MQKTETAGATDGAGAKGLLLGLQPPVLGLEPQ